MHPCGQTQGGGSLASWAGTSAGAAPPASPLPAAGQQYPPIVLDFECPAETLFSFDAFHSSGGISGATGGSGSWSGSPSGSDSRGAKRQRTPAAADNQRSCHMLGTVALKSGGQYAQPHVQIPDVAFVQPASAQLRLPLPPQQYPAAVQQPWQPAQQQQYPAAAQQPWAPAEQQQTAWCSLHMAQALQHQQRQKQHQQRQKHHQQRREQQPCLGGMPLPLVLPAPPTLRAIRTRPEHSPAPQLLQQAMPALPFSSVSQVLPLPAPACRCRLPPPAC